MDRLCAACAEVGRIIGAAAAKTLKPVTLELVSVPYRWLCCFRHRPLCRILGCLIVHCLYMHDNVASSVDKNVSVKELYDMSRFRQSYL